MLAVGFLTYLCEFSWGGKKGGSHFFIHAEGRVEFEDGSQDDAHLVDKPAFQPKARRVGSGISRRPQISGINQSPTTHYPRLDQGHAC
jgi:hypothetical protein